MFHVKHHDFYRYLFTIPFFLYLVFRLVLLWSFHLVFLLVSLVAFLLVFLFPFYVFFLLPANVSRETFIFIAIRLSQTVTHILQKHFTLSPVVSLYQLYYNINRVCLREKR